MWEVSSCENQRSSGGNIERSVSIREVNGRGELRVVSEVPFSYVTEGE